MDNVTVRIVFVTFFLLTPHIVRCNTNKNEIEAKKYSSQNPWNLEMREYDDDTSDEELSTEETVPSQGTAIEEEDSTSKDDSISEKPSLEQTRVKCREINISNLTFPETGVNSWSTSKNICLHDDYTPVRLYCDKYGRWNVTYSNLLCANNIKETTQNLYNILQNNESVVALNSTNEILTRNREQLKAIDIHYISQILSKTSYDKEVIKEPDLFVKIVDNLMDINKTTLKQSQNLLNSTDTILYNFDQLLLNSKNTTLVTPKLLICTVEARAGNITGALITNKIDISNFQSFQLEYLYENTYVEKLENTDFEIAFVVPNSMENNYFVTLFYNDHLFPQENHLKSVGSWILSILMPNGGRNDSIIEIYFKEFGNTANQNCEYWKYGTENRLPIMGSWSSEGQAKKFKERIFICKVNHTTHFGMLVSGSLNDNFYLDLITIFGSILSLIGIIIIFVTALIFKEWRNKTNNKIILNISFCLLLLIILFLISDKVQKGPLCIITGIFLHYIVLAQFCWSLTISYSSYRRLCLISLDNIDHVVRKFCIFSWGLPLIVIVTVSALSVETYDKTMNSNHSQICYPKGIYFKLGVCLPMGLILAINLIIYLLIIKSLLGNKFDLRKHVSKKSFSIQKSIILLFFMMAISWIFGFLVAFTDNIVFVYLFCTTATCHGFVIFLFYILDSTDMKHQWKKIFQQIFCKKIKERPISTEKHSTRTEEISDSTTKPN